MMALSAFWSLILTFESATPNIAEKVILSEFEYFANMVIPIMFLRFILSYDLDHSVRLKRYFLLFWIIPVITVVLVFTHKLHSLIWTGFSWSPAGHNILIYHHGFAFYVAMAYSLGIIFLGNILLIRFIRKRPGYYQSKGWVLLSGSLFALLTGLVYTLGLSPVEGLDISPMGTLIAGLIFFRGIARDQLFDLIPFSHQLMIEKLKDGVIVLDSRDFIMDISPVASKALQIEREVTGHKFTEVLPVFLPIVEETSKDQEFRKEIEIKSPAVGWFEVTRYPLSRSETKFLGSLLILHDINHRKDTEMQLRKLAEELTELNRMKDRIYSIISHDLRNPFNTILGFSQLLSESYDEFSESERRNFADNILNASKSAFNLLENLLEWSLMQLGKYDFVPQQLILDHQVDESFTLIRPMASGKKIELINAVPPGLCVFADRNMVAAILRNLISNAVKFTPVGGCIEVSSSLDHDWVEVVIADNGIGMTAQVIADLFSYSKMQTKQGTSSEKGTGLGLLLVRDFVQKHQGSIRVTSEPGKGSRFIFTLPVK
jgi:signal transduction histidine kinase